MAISTAITKLRRRAKLSEAELSEGERLLLDLFRRVPEDQQKLVLQMIRAALKTRESSL